MQVDDALWSEVARLVADMAEGRYDAIERDGRAGRLTAHEIRTASDEYGRTLVPVPAHGRAISELYPERNVPERALLDVPLWTKEEGRSDLTLTLRVTQDGDKYEIAISDLHVL